MATDKNWWAPVWRGLVVDPGGKHCRQMKNAIWLFLHLVLHADRRSGRLKRKCRTIAEETGLPEATIRKWLAILKKHGYAETRSNGRCLEIVIRQWKTFPRYAEMDGQNDKTSAARLLQNGQSYMGPELEKTFVPEGKMIDDVLSNDSELKKE